MTHFAALEGSPLWQLTLSRTRGFLREPEAVFWTFAFPILLALALGIAFRSQKPAPLPVALVPGAGTAAVHAALAASAELRLVPVASADDAELALRSGKIVAVVHAAPSPPGLHVAYDPTRQEGRLAELLVRDALERAAGRPGAAAVEARTERRRGARYIDFLLPGLIGMNLMGTGMWGVGFPIAAARQQKLLKRYMATPMRRGEYLFSFVLARMLWLVLEVGLLLAFGRLAFGVRMTGSWPAYAAVVLVGALCFSALGLLVVCRARTIEAVSGLMNVAMLPMWLFSGTFFASERFPAALQPLILALPLTPLNNALRALTNEASGWGAVPGPLLILSVWCVVSFLLAIRFFRWE